MAMRDLWKKTMVSLGLADGEEEFDEAFEQAPRRESPSVRTLGSVERSREDHHPAGRGALRSVPQTPPRQVHVVEPRRYDEVQDLADRFKSGVPIIVNMKMTDERNSAKILQFASGLAYGLNGRIQRVGDGVFLLTPFNMEVSADEKRRLAEHGLFGFGEV